MSLSCSHYISSTLLLSFLETPASAYICAYTFIRATHFSRFIPLSFFPLFSLVNMIFLNSYLLSPHAFALLYCYFPLLFRRISFRSHIVVTSLSLSLVLSTIHSWLPSQSNSHYLSFLFSVPLLFAALLSRFVLPLYCISSPRALFSVIIFSTLPSHAIFIVPSQLLQSSHCNSRVEMDFHSPCVISCDGLRT